TTAAARPQLSSACPAVLRLIRLRFPKLIPHVLPIISPVELAAILARREAAAETGLSPEEIGVFSIVPCSSRVTAASAPDALATPVIDGALAVRDIYLKLLTPMKELQTEDLLPLSHAGIMGVGWAYLGGMSAARLNDSYVAVDGIRNCIRMLEEIEDGRLPEVEFIELNACVRGCVGGCLNVANPFAAHMRIKKLMHDLPFARNRYDSKANGQDILFGRALQYIPAFVLDSDRGVALEKLTKIEELARTLPGLDCGSCGAPCCHALAEDVVLGRATLDDCIFKVRERMQQMQKRTGDCNADDYLPAPFRRRRRALVPPNSGKEEET
ncbi:MAG: ferredoxin, partial [Clostridiales bacterium]|nr:ferredoxin [Clostridiales bacterium]